jgi:tetratricopeptide (TPR) repeat protein
MTNVAEALAWAKQAHQAGQLQQAETLYRQVLRVEPANADALHLLGVLAYQAGQHQLALDYIGKALAVRPQDAAFHSNRGLVLDALGRWDEAVACYREALRLRPDDATVHNNLGNAIRRQGRLHEATACYREALRLRPNYPQAHNNLGNALKEQGRLDEAIAYYREAARLLPAFPEAHCNLGNAFEKQGRLNEAVPCYREALRLRPDYPEARGQLERLSRELPSAARSVQEPDDGLAGYREAIRLLPNAPEVHFNLGIALQRQGRLDEAVASYRQAIRLRPSYHKAFHNLGDALQRLGRFDDAIACFREAIRSLPDSAESHYNLGTALHGQGRLDDAIACYEEAIRLRPDYPEAHNNLGQCWLLKGQFQRGWAEYEWHLRCPGIGSRSFRQPQWDGTPLGGRRILLYADQGLGDNLQFARFAGLVQQRGGYVIMECLPSLAPLLSTCPGIDRLVAQGSVLPEFDVHAAMLSLPGLLGTTVETIPADVPYVHADPQHRRRWQQELQATGTWNVGIVWQGRPTHGQDRTRSVLLEFFAPLARIPGVRLVRLQRGPGSEQLAQLRGQWEVFDPPGWPEDHAEAWLESAALVSALDLVITVDTSVAHLAGSLAAPVWVALPFVPDWRWLLEREDCPWYPTMRLFRQQRLGDWPGVFERLADALRQRFPARRPCGGELSS